MNPLKRWLSPTRTRMSSNVLPSDQMQSKAALPGEAKNVSGSMFALHAHANAIWSQADYASLAQNGYMRNPVVHRCVRMISEAASTVPFLLYEDAQELNDHPLLRLLKTPNANATGRAMMQSIYGHLLVSGNAYVEIVHSGVEPLELHALRPDRMRVLTDKNGWPSGFEYSTGNRTLRHKIDDSGASPILHLTLFHQMDDQYGFPPLQAALMALDVHNAASRWNKSLLDNSARPSGALVYSAAEGANLTEEQFERLKNELENGYSGAHRAGRPLLLEGGLDWKAMGYSPKDMDFMEAKNGAARDIALAFGVPPMLLGIPGDNTYSNYKEANIAFWRQTVLPLVGRISDALGGWLCAHYSSSLRLSFNIDQIDGLAGEREARWKRLQSADFLTIDEKRAALGYGPIEDGESLSR